MERKKLHLEYLLNGSSKSVLWSSISTPSGLEGWFADKVETREKVFTFCWGKTERRPAELLAARPNVYVRFRWLDDENEREFFEMRIATNELTNDYVLEITDFADEDELDDLTELWDSQVDTLRRTCGF